MIAEDAERRSRSIAAPADRALAEGPIFLHSMWRTGSSFLLSRFEAEAQYLAFYEPFNGEIGSAHLRRAAAASYATRHNDLGHPRSDNGYFAAFDTADPKTGRPLWRYAHPRLPLYDVYNGLSSRGSVLLEACQRAAAREHRVPVFGFCHSGIQIAGMKRRFGGRHLYLYRPPRDQFRSYRPQSNDFFVAATIVQLLSSRHLARTAVALVPSLAAYQGVATRVLVERAPHRITMRLARRLWRLLDLNEMYLIFYLSWLVSNEMGKNDCEARFSLAQWENFPAERAAFEARFSIDLSGLRYPKPESDSLAIDFDHLEGRVQAAVANLSNRQYPVSRAASRFPAYAEI